MTERTYFESLTGVPFSAFEKLPRDRWTTVIREAVPDLHAFLDEGADLETRRAPETTRAMAVSLHGAVVAAIEATGETPSPSLAARIVTHAVLRAEADRDQNVYLGRFFTRVLTNALPDAIFQPESFVEAAAALDWAARLEIPVVLRGAGSTAMGGSVPHEGGLTLDPSRLDRVEILEHDGLCMVDAGARLRDVHAVLAERGLALPAYPSNLGGTFAGWFVTGGIGMNAFGRGRAIDAVASADVVLAGGQRVRFHRDGRLDVFERGVPRSLDADEAAAWFRTRGHDPLTLTDVAGSEGVFGLVLRLTLKVEPRPRMSALLLSFGSRAEALATVERLLDGAASDAGPVAANLKLLSRSHMQHIRRVWSDEDVREWKAHPSHLTSGATMPWAAMSCPDGPGATAETPTSGEAYLFVDFFDASEAERFAQSAAELPGAPVWSRTESLRFAVERFKPQQSKRLGPGLLAAEILMPAKNVGRYLAEMERVARNAGVDPDAEVYYLADGTALVIGAYLTDHRRGGFLFELLVAPTLLDLAMRRFGGRPYVLGRWQAAYVKEHFGRRAAGLERIKQALDPRRLLNRGVLFGLQMCGPLGAMMNATFVPMVRLARLAYSLPFAAAPARILKGVFDAFPGVAAGRGERAVLGAGFRTKPVGRDPHADGAPPGAEATKQQASARALHCVNCGECNSVCPIFVDSKIRLPQMLTHIGEAMHGGTEPGDDARTLLDLCMRCGNCEEVCQAGIPHLPLYEVMSAKAPKPQEPERHLAILAAVRSSTRYKNDFLHIRPGAYAMRAPASLPKVPGYILLRSENDAGPAATCIHCGACVPVCPTEANFEFKGEDVRWITTDQSKCIGCGTCVEVCPANLMNGGQTLRVMEAPTLSWFEALDEFEKQEASRT